jgi:hypothetical protein
MLTMIKTTAPSRLIVLLITLFMLAVASSQTYSGTFRHPKLIENHVSPLHDSANSIVHNAYIIRLSDTARDVKSIMMKLLGASVNDEGNYTHVFQYVFKGFSVGGMSNPRMTQILDRKIVTVPNG